MTATARSSRVEDAYEDLKSRILENRLPPGLQATEQEVAEMLGMSRTPVREALIRLQAEGLVELVPRRGARVLPVSAGDMREIYAILTALEPEAAASAAAAGPTDEQLAALESATAEMERSLERADLDGWAEADDRFHRALLDLGDNQRLASIVKGLLDQAHRARMVTLRLRELPTRSTAEHREILRKIRAGDPEGARAAFRDHRIRAAGELVSLLERSRLDHL